MTEYTNAGGQGRIT